MEELAEGNEVVVLDRFSTGDPDRLPGEVDLVEGDVRDPGAVESAVDGCGLVFHLAAQVSVEKSVEDPLKNHSVNVEGSLNVLEAARREEARFVAASSAAVYGRPEELPLPEESRKEPVSPYGLGKLAMDRYTLMYSDLYGLPAVSLRFFNLYGPGQMAGDYGGVISIFARQAAEEGPITVDGGGSQTRDFLHVDEAVRAFRLAGSSDITGTAFNIGSGEETSILELAELFRSAAETDLEIVHEGARPGDIQRSVADISRAKEGLGFEPKIGIEEGIRSVMGEKGLV